MSALPVVSGYYLTSPGSVCSVGTVGVVGSMSPTGVSGSIDSVGSIGSIDLTGPPGPIDMIGLAVPGGHAGSSCLLGVADHDGGMCSVRTAGLAGVLGLSGAVCLPGSVMATGLADTAKSSIMCVQ